MDGVHVLAGLAGLLALFATVRVWLVERRLTRLREDLVWLANQVVKVPIPPEIAPWLSTTVSAARRTVTGQIIKWP